MSVLLQGAGGVSLFALQFAKLFSARVIMLSSSQKRCATLKEFGADDTINYTADIEWDATIRKLTDQLGVDLTLEVGGAKTIERSLRSTRIGGRVALIGLLTGRADASLLAAQGKELTPIMVGSRQDFDAMNRAIKFHRLRPLIDSTYVFEDLLAALKTLTKGSHMGKIVIRMADA